MLDVRCLHFYCVTGCSTCAQAKAWLSEHEISFTYRDMIKTAMTVEEIRSLAEEGHLQVRDLVNLRSQAFKKLRPALDDMDEAAIIALLQTYPRMMIRPIISGKGIFISGFKAADYANKL